MLQSHAIQELHDDERLTIFLANFMDRADIRMVQSRGRLRLPLEPGQRLRIFGQVSRQELQSDEAMQGKVLGLVHYTHAAAAELFDDTVMRDGSTDHSGDTRLSGHLILWTRHRPVNE